VQERFIEAEVHGRYLTVPPAAPGPAPVLIGFHGYAENAEIQLERLRTIPESHRWIVVSIQALHRFYQRQTNLVVASWMTRQDRETAIADNIAYVNKCIDAVTAEWPALPTIVFAGFSQGVGMAFRAAVHSTHGTAGVSGVIAAGGDIPPEITPTGLSRVSAALIARGKSDLLCTAEQFDQDEQRLRNCSVRVDALRFDGGHEWSSDLIVAAAQFLRELHP
jgi:predicted esterase